MEVGDPKSPVDGKEKERKEWAEKEERPENGEIAGRGESITECFVHRDN